MAKETPIFSDVTFWLNKICILPYTEEELDSMGCLGFDMKHNHKFADKYLQKLLEYRHLIAENKHIAFADLNLQIYREVLSKPDLKQIPDWITDISHNKDALPQNPIKTRIIQMYRDINQKKNIISSKPNKIR